LKDPPREALSRWPANFTDSHWPANRGKSQSNSICVRLGTLSEELPPGCTVANRRCAVAECCFYCRPSPPLVCLQQTMWICGCRCAEYSLFTSSSSQLMLDRLGPRVDAGLPGRLSMETGLIHTVCLGLVGQRPIRGPTCQPCPLILKYDASLKAHYGCPILVKDHVPLFMAIRLPPAPLHQRMCRRQRST
jgi:hypothetical protein